jgi:peroxiredoxin
MKHSLIALASTALLGFSVPALAADTAEVGKPAPAFTLKDEAGKTHSLSEYKGKVVVLEWTNPECPFVQRHYSAHTMVNTQKGFDAKKVVWLAVDSTNTHTAQTDAAWKKEQGFSYPVLLDADGSVGHAYGAKTTPHMFIVDPQGKIAYNGAIDDDPSGRKAKAERVNYVGAGLNAEQTGARPDPAATKPYGCTVKY